MQLSITEKYWVLLFEFLNLFGDAVLARISGTNEHPAIGCRHFLYGARETHERPGDWEWMVDFATAMGVLGQPSSRRKGYLIDPQSAERYRDLERAVSHNTHMHCQFLADWIMEANGADGLGGDFLIAITSVESEDSYCKSLLAELDGWVEDHEHGHRPALNLLDQALKENSKQSIERADKALERLANWHAQAKKKHSLRTHFDEFLKRADAKWGDRTVSARFWRHVVRPSIMTRMSAMPTVKGYSTETLHPILSVAGKASTLLRNWLSGFARINTEKALALAESAQVLEDTIKKLPTHLEEYFRPTRHDLQLLKESTDVRKAFPVLRRVVQVIADGIGCARTMAPESTQTQSRAVPAGRFILLWDLAGSTTKDYESVMDALLAANSAIRMAFEKRVVDFDSKSPNDGVGAICESFKEAMSLAHSLCQLVPTGFHFRFGCTANSEGALRYYPMINRYGGIAYAYAARMRDFFKATATDSACWKADDKGGPIPAGQYSRGSYLVLSDDAFRRIDKQEDANLLRQFAELRGLYLPNIRGATWGRVQICQLPLPFAP